MSEKPERGDRQDEGREAADSLREEDRDTARLIARAQGGESDAFARVYSRYFDRVLNYIRVALDDHHESEDAAQQVFANALAALAGYEEREGQPFRGWLFAIARNQAVSAIRARARVEPMDPAEIAALAEAEAEAVAEEAEEPPELGDIDWVTDSDISLLMERLSPAQRQVVSMRYRLDLSPTEIAEALGMTPGQVRALQHRALTFFRKRLAAVGRTGPRDDTRNNLVRRSGHAYVLRKRRFALFD